MNYLPRIPPNALHGRGPSGRPRSISLRNPRVGGGLYMLETTTKGKGRRVEELTAAVTARRRQRGRGGVLRSCTSVSNRQIRTRPHSSAINGQCTVKTANVRFEHL